MGGFNSFKQLALIFPWFCFPFVFDVFLEAAKDEFSEQLQRWRALHTTVVQVVNNPRCSQGSRCSFWQQRRGVERNKMEVLPVLVPECFMYLWQKPRAASLHLWPLSSMSSVYLHLLLSSLISSRLAAFWETRVFFPSSWLVKMFQGFGIRGLFWTELFWSVIAH